jgi:superfamily I DNA/RNA helicase
MIEDHVAHQDKVLPEWLRERWTKKGIPTKAITECLAWYCAHDAPFLRKIIHVRTKLLSKRNNIRVLFSKEEDARSKRTLKQDLEVYEYLYVHLKDVYGKMSNYKRDMRRIFCNMSLLKKHMPDWSEERLKNVITFNDLLIRRSAGAKMNVGPCVGYDDIPILIRIIQVKNGGLVDYETNNVYHYDHIFVDEAQDFGAVALKVLMSTVRSRTGVTIVGDKNQKIFHSSKFVAWSSIAKELGIPESEVNNLTVSHRSQHEITRFCDWVLGDEFVDNNPIRDEYMPTFIQSRDVEGLYETLFSTVMQRYIEHPNKHHVVICNWPQEAQSIMERAQKYFAAYDVEAPLRRGYKETFVFSSGITFTNRQQIKGLEFDSVFVFEPNIEQFSDNEQGRCSFYTVISRPREHLSFFGVNEPCSLLVQAIEEGMVMDLSSHSFVLDDEDLDMDF